MTLTPRERVLAAIDHEEPDRVPIVIGVSSATSLKMGPYRALKQSVGVESEEKYLYDWPELGTADPDEQTMIRLHSDVRGVLDREPASVLERNRRREPHVPFIDSWGSGQKEIQPGVWFPGVCPLANTTSIDDLESYPWPDMDDPSRVAHVKRRAEWLAEQNEYAIMGTPWLLFPLERAFAMQGMDRFLLNMISHPEFAVALLREMGEHIDIIKIGDDLGTQRSLLISPTMYREMLKPIHAEFVAFIKGRTGAKVLFHTDGDVFPLIEDFIEIGIDILNPIQTSAGKMANLEELKSRFGRDIVFCGGIDTHHTLPNGTPEEVRREVKRVIETLAPGGGYLVSAVHTIMDGVPPENILAMVDAVEEFGRYPIAG